MLNSQFLMARLFLMVFLNRWALGGLPSRTSASSIQSLGQRLSVPTRNRPTIRTKEVNRTDNGRLAAMVGDVQTWRFVQLFMFSAGWQFCALKSPLCAKFKPFVLPICSCEKS